MGSAISRRGVIRLSAAGLAAMVIGGNGIGMRELWADQSEQMYTPGTYEAIAHGKWMPFEVRTTFDEHSIVSVDIGEHHETGYITDSTFEELPAAIVQNQSLSIDTVTGATITGYAILEAVADCVRQAGGDPEALKASQAIGDSDEVVEIDTELVIAGAGAAGMACAVAAVQQGAKDVIVLEKTSNMGGNALVSGGFLGYPCAPQDIRPQMTDGLRDYFASVLDYAKEHGVDPAFVQAVQDEYDEYYAAGNTTVFDSIDFYALDQMMGVGTDYKVTKARAGAFIEFNEWLTSLGYEWGVCTPIAGFPYPRWSRCAWTSGDTASGVFDTYSGAIDEANMPIMLMPLTPAKELMVEDGKVVGIVAVAEDGTTYKIRSSKGVVLATGGYSGNSDLIHELDTYWGFEPDAYIPTDNTYGHTGDGLLMAVEAGAQGDTVGLTMCLSFVDPVDMSVQTNIADADKVMSVNCEGRRYVNEAADRYTLSAAMMAQPGQMGFNISSGDNTVVVDGCNANGFPIDWLVERGSAYVADSLSELAQLCGFDEEVFASTVETYNKAVENGLDEEFGRAVFAPDCVIKTPPFYAVPRAWCAHITIGGVAVDEGCRALTPRGSVVDGLYCVGEVANQQAGITVMGDAYALARNIFSA